MNLAEAEAEFRRLSKQIDGGIKSMRQYAREEADAAADYRKGKSEAWVRCPTGTKDWPAARREAWVDAETAELRRVRDIAAGMSRAAMHAVRARQTQVSSLQSLLSAHRAEAELAR